LAISALASADSEESVALVVFFRVSFFIVLSFLFVDMSDDAFGIPVWFG
jgi:hypothetical protein